MGTSNAEDRWSPWVEEETRVSESEEETARGGSAVQWTTITKNDEILLYITELSSLALSQFIRSLGWSIGPKAKFVPAPMALEGRTSRKTTDCDEQGLSDGERSSRFRFRTLGFGKTVSTKRVAKKAARKRKKARKG